MAILRLKEVMQQKGVTGVKLAQQIGSSAQTITNINSELTLPSLKTLVEIARALDVDIRELFNPTKSGATITQSNIDSTKELLESAIKLLKGE